MTNASSSIKNQSTEITDTEEKPTNIPDADEATSELSNEQLETMAGGYYSEDNLPLRGNFGKVPTKT